MEFRETTIEGDICGDLRDTLTKEGMMSCSNEAKTNRHPSAVLNILEAEGYKVVGTNTITCHGNHQSITSHHLIWTLHKQA